MRSKIIHILKGKFLVNEGAFKNWMFIIYASILGLIMIASSHSADQKVFLISNINEDIKALRSVYVENKSRLQYVRLKSTLVKKLKQRGIQYPEKPLKRVIIKKNKEW